MAVWVHQEHWAHWWVVRETLQPMEGDARKPGLEGVHLAMVEWLGLVVVLQWGLGLWLWLGHQHLQALALGVPQEGRDCCYLAGPGTTQVCQGELGVVRQDLWEAPLARAVQLAGRQRGR